MEPRNMGKQKPVNKTMSPAELIKAFQAGNLTFAQAQQMYNGAILIGDYKGLAAALDIDLLVVQPLVAAERLYALDRIDARDIVTATLPAAALVGASVRAQLGPVPEDEVWFLNRVTLVSPIRVGVEAIAQLNFRISAWAIPDIRAGVTPDVDGRSYWPADQGTAAADAFVVDFPAQGELGEELRLVAGNIITLVATVTAAAVGVAAINTTLTPFGRKGKLLVA